MLEGAERTSQDLPASVVCHSACIGEFCGALRHRLRAGCQLLIEFRLLDGLEQVVRDSALKGLPHKVVVVISADNDDLGRTRHALKPGGELTLSAHAGILTSDITISGFSCVTSPGACYTVLGLSDNCYAQLVPVAQRLQDIPNMAHRQLSLQCSSSLSSLPRLSLSTSCKTVPSPSTLCISTPNGSPPSRSLIRMLTLAPNVSAGAQCAVACGVQHLLKFRELAGRYSDMRYQQQLSPAVHDCARLY